MTDNHETWLEFTDLVFIDPIGTGFSRIIKDNKAKEISSPGACKEAGGGPENTEYYQLKRDLESLSEFMQKFLSRYHVGNRPSI